MAIYWFWFHYPTCRNVQRPHCTVHESAWCASLPVRTLKISISFPLTLISFHKNKFLSKAKKQEETTSASSVTLDKAVRTTIRLNLNYPESVKTNPPTLTKIDHNSSEIKKKSNILCLSGCNKENASNIAVNQVNTTKFLKRKGLVLTA